MIDSRIFQVVVIFVVYLKCANCSYTLHTQQPHATRTGNFGWRAQTTTYNKMVLGMLHY